MSSLSTKHVIVLNLMVSFMICQEWHKKFCEEDIIDAVVVGKNHFSLTRGQWIADYDEKTGTIGPYIRSILPGFESIFNLKVYRLLDTTFSLLNVSISKITNSINRHML